MYSSNNQLPRYFYPRVLDSVVAQQYLLVSFGKIRNQRQPVGNQTQAVNVDGKWDM